MATNTRLAPGLPARKLPSWASSNADVRDFGSQEFSPEAAPKTGSLASTFTKVAPYLTNIANQFSKPPLPVKRTALKPISLDRVSFDADRAEVDRSIRGANLAAERTLDGNTAAAVRTAGLTQGMRSLSDISQRESNVNTQIGNQEVLHNSRIDAINAEGEDQYNSDVLERTMAIQGNRSANLANASDKFTASQNEQAKRELDREKMIINSRLFPDVAERLKKFYEDNGIQSYKLGGKLRRAF